MFDTSSVERIAINKTYPWLEISRSGRDLSRNRVDTNRMIDCAVFGPEVGPNSREGCRDTEPKDDNEEHCT